MKRDNLIFIHKLLKAIADSIIKVFIPLYILKTSDDYTMAISYLLIYTSFVVFYMFLFKKLIQKHGVLLMMISCLPTIASGGILSFCSINWYTIVGVAALMGLSQAFYSIPLNLVFTFSDKKSNVGKFQIASNIGKLLFTLVSGLLLSSEVKNSFLIVSIAASVFYLSCMIPLGFIYHKLEEEYEKYEALPQERIEISKWFILFHITFGMFQPIMDNLVPIYLYMNDLSFKAVTLMIVLVELIKIGMNFLAQKLVKKKLSILCVSISALLFIFSAICMIVVKKPVWLYVFSTTVSISFPLTFVPMFKKYCGYLRDTSNVFSGMTRRDFEIFLPRIGLYSLGFLGFGLIPCILLGIGIVPIMLVSEIKIVKE